MPIFVSMCPSRDGLVSSDGRRNLSPCDEKTELGGFDALECGPELRRCVAGKLVRMGLRTRRRRAGRRDEGRYFKRSRQYPGRRRP